MYLFFLLSGFVLALPAARGKSVDYRSYYPKRLIRLYLPVWGAVAFSACVVLAVPRRFHAGASWWINHHDLNLSLKGVVKDLTLLKGNDEMNSVLWSLKWEILFSLMLPLYVLLSRRVSASWWLKILVCLTIIEAGSLGDNAYLTYLPIFAIGTVLAFERQRIGRMVERIGFRRKTPTGLLMLVVALLLLSVRWTLSARRQPSSRVLDLSLGVEVLGALVILLLFLYWRPTEWLGTAPYVQWLGKRSFSLYLVHEPVVVSIAVLLGHAHADLTILIAVPIALVAADLFYRLVEGPSHRLSQRVGAAIGTPRRGKHAVRRKGSPTSTMPTQPGSLGGLAD